MKQIGLIAGAAALIAALIFLNVGIGKNAQPDSDGDQSSSQSQAQTPPPKAPATAPGAPPSAPSPTLPAEQALGDPAAKYKITVGWAYDGTNQAHPEALNQSLDAVRRFAAAHKDAAVQIVNVDVPAEARSPGARAVAGPGIAVNGKPLPGLTANPGEGPATPGQIAAALNATVH